MLESTSARPERETADQGIEVAMPGSAALQRLIDEVCTSGEPTITATIYNRTYHRHNR